NLVDITATSIAEILTELMQQYEQQLIDEDIATCLLTGIVDKTASFQQAQTTPKSFLKASDLVNLGGRQQEVIKNIYKTKPLSLLKLWGRALARLKIYEAQKALCSVLGPADFERAESSEAEVLPALAELVNNVSGYDAVLLIAEPVKGRACITAALHERLPTAEFLGRLKENGRILPQTLGHYRLLQTEKTGQSAEALEQRVTDALKTGF
ncbi:MAG TPA: hypothetical protein VHA30_04375, partial [Patescibacteria group bacterium]|nr:hypothetical protein [Patescibacteria group bacterium]